jgi:hypothetical protein
VTAVKLRVEVCDESCPEMGMLVVVCSEEIDRERDETSDTNPVEVPALEVPLISVR